MSQQGVTSFRPLSPKFARYTNVINVTSLSLNSQVSQTKDDAIIMIVLWNTVVKLVLNKNKNVV